MNGFRKILRTVHRELGFLAVGLIVVYAISGIAYNHKDDWDPSFVDAVENLRIDPPGTGPTAEVRPLVLERLGITEPVKNVWRSSEEEFQVFLEKDQFDVNLATGEVVRSGKKKRSFFYDLNIMHHNVGQGKWTWVADVFAGILIFLAFSGMLMVKGSKGLKGRGGLLTALGIILPIVYTLMIRS